MSKSKQIIIIPGIGDDHWVYHLAASIFGLFGFKTHIRTFEWSKPVIREYDGRMAELQQYIQNLQASNIYILGVSAGGPIALSQFAMNPGKVTRIATLSSPLTKFSYRVNPLLEVAIEDAERKFAHMSEPQKQSILSVHGLADQVVATKLSKPPGVKTAVLPSWLHVTSIFLGLSILIFPILRFFKQS